MRIMRKPMRSDSLVQVDESGGDRGNGCCHEAVFDEPAELLVELLIKHRQHAQGWILHLYPTATQTTHEDITAQLRT